MASLGKVMGIVEAAVCPDGRNLWKEDYVVSFKGQIPIQVETDVDAENRAYRQLFHLEQVRVVAFREQEAKEGLKMVAETSKKKVIGYYTEDGNIYCVDCINENVRIMKDIDKAITAKDPGDTVLFCEGCDKRIN